SIARFCSAPPRFTIVKQPDCWTNTRSTASGLPRLYSRHHWLSGSTIAIVPRLRVHRGISWVPLACALRPDDSPLAEAGPPATKPARAAAANIFLKIMVFPHYRRVHSRYATGAPSERPHGTLSKCEPAYRYAACLLFNPRLRTEGGGDLSAA